MVVEKQLQLFGDTVDVGVVEWWTGFTTPNYGLAEAAKDLVFQLNNDWDSRPGPLKSSTQNIIFVTHSTGGVVVTRAVADNPMLRDRNVGLFLMASPGRGALTQIDNTAIGKFVPEVMKLFERFGGPQVVDLMKRNSGFLIDTRSRLLQRWRPLSEPVDGRAPIFVRELCETLGLNHKRFGAQTQLVPPLSCSMYTGDGALFVPDVDHFEISRPHSNSAPTFARFSNFARSFRDSLVAERRLLLSGVLRTYELKATASERKIFFAPNCVHKDSLLVQSISDSPLQESTAILIGGSASVLDGSNSLGKWSVSFEIDSSKANLRRILLRYTTTGQALTCSYDGQADAGYVLPTAQYSYQRVEQAYVLLDSVSVAESFDTRLFGENSVWRKQCRWPTGRDATDPSLRCEVAVEVKGHTYDLSSISALRLETANPTSGNFQLKVLGPSVSIVIPSSP